LTSVICKYTDLNCNLQFTQ